MPPALIRKARAADAEALADLRWRLQTEDAPITDPIAYAAFLQSFAQWMQSAADVVHWVAEDGGAIVGAMTIIVVKKVPAPTDPHGRWGYLTNCYVRPEARNRGVGEALLAQVKAWARIEALELLTVWPSDRAYPFYERAGFKRAADPLTLPLD